MKIPHNSKRVFKGIIFDVYQWQQKMFDGSYETFEALKRPDSVQIIATQKNKVLLAAEEQPNKKPFYGLFGGRVEKEKPLEAAKRERLEETGMRSTNWELIQVTELYHKIGWKIYLFIAKDCKKMAEPNLDSGERIKTVKLSFEDFIFAISSGNFRGKELFNTLLKAEYSKKQLQLLKEKLFH